MNRDHAVGFGIGLFAGAVIGGVVALLYTPKTGKETRQYIKEKAGDVVTGVKEKTGDVMESVREVASEANRKGQAAIHALKN